MSVNWILLFAGLAAILLELFIGIETGFDLVLIGIALVVGGGVGHITGNLMAGILVTTLISVSYIVFGRRFVKNKLKAATKHTNVESLIGKKGIVEKAISPSKAGQVRINGEVWRATARKKIVKGQTVTVEDIAGVTVRVIEYK